MGTKREKARDCLQEGWIKERHEAQREKEEEEGRGLSCGASPGMGEATSTSKKTSSSTEWEDGNHRTSDFRNKPLLADQ